ncbi:hypothetical protein PybrP1_006353 [[Pythium] brassicae (nom. inval.)]|nr:hypothetical protein PybrP1_006353 [[Pythium] brassicae (nom. inval.)]
MRDAASTTATMNAKERRKLQREQERLAAAAVTQVATSSEPVKEEEAKEPLNAKQRRKLARTAEQAPVAVPAPAPTKATEKTSGAEDATSTAASEKLNAKQRRLLARKASRPAEQAASKKTSTSNDGSKKRKRKATAAADTTIADPAAKKAKSIHLTLFVGQLPFNTTEQKLREHFHEAGEIQVRMLTDKRTKKFKGTAFIEVKDSKALGAALSRHHTLLHGRRINVEMTASGGGTKSELRRTKIDELRKKQSTVQVEKTKALIEKHIASREYKLTAADVDDRMIDFLSWFDYETAKTALEEYNRCVSDRVQNRKAFFMGILKRFRETDGVE